jgi:hypothetical protein
MEKIPFLKSQSSTTAAISKNISANNHNSNLGVSSRLISWGSDLCSMCVFSSHAFFYTIVRLAEICPTALNHAPTFLKKIFF